MLQITTSPDLSTLTTLRLGGNAIALIDVFEKKALEQLPHQIYKIGGKPHILGGGSNILASDGSLPFVLIRSKILHDPIVTYIDEQGVVFVKVCAAMGLARFLAWCCKEGLSGMENLAGIPGTIGGAVAGNAGSYGLSIGECIYELEIFSFNNGMKILKNDEIQYAYRKFSIDEEPGEFIIITATVKLKYKQKQQIIEVIRENVAKKTSVQPVQARSAGCIFKNPNDGLSAGKLLEQVGFKGKGKGGIGFSSIHANFLINEGSKNSKIAFELVQDAKQEVQKSFNIILQTEVKVWSC